MAETGEVDGSNTIGITEVGFAADRFSITLKLTVLKISKSTVLEHRASSLSRWRKTSHHSPW